MKQNMSSLKFNKNSIIELNNNQLLRINGGDSTERPFTKNTSTITCETLDTVTNPPPTSGLNNQP
jgi:hypothetical protein